MKRLTLAAGVVFLAACSDSATAPVQTVAPSLTPSFTLAPGNNTVVVGEGSIARQAENTAPTKSWVFYVRNAATGTFVLGPGTPPRGDGSFQVSTPGSNDKGTLFNFDHTGTALSSIDAISYSTYQVAPNPAEGRQLPSLNIQVDFNGSDVGGFTTLVYEPVYNDAAQPIVGGEWQTWNAYTGRWWSSNPINGLPNRDTFLDWATIVSLNPDAVIVGGVGINQGSGNAGLVGAADALTLGYGGNSVTYDFEDTTCQFTPDGNTLNLDGDCVTTSTILVPAGFTFNGNGHTITAMDPAGGHFVGAIIRNTPNEDANITNLTVTASGLSDACDAGDYRLRGIMIEGGSGSITNNVVTGVRQGLSGCQEGNSIEARNYPGTVKKTVTISGNTVSNYMKSGIVMSGQFNGTITGNTVTGDGPINYTAQNGIQVGYGATAIVKNNTVSGNFYAPKEWTACGLLIIDAAGVKASSNILFNNEINQCNSGKGSGNVKAIN